jgi:hypothetical protein
MSLITSLDLQNAKEDDLNYCAVYANTKQQQRDGEVHASLDYDIQNSIELNHDV